MIETALSSPSACKNCEDLLRICWRIAPPTGASIGIGRSGDAITKPRRNAPAIENTASNCANQLFWGLLLMLRLAA
jgi:hypothetical protein